MRSRTPKKSKLALSLQAKVLALVLIPMIIITAAIVTKSALDAQSESKVMLEERRADLIQSRKNAVRDVVRAAHGAIEPLVKDNSIPDSEAQERAKTSIRNIVFEDNNYVFVYDYQGNNLVTRPSPEQEGTNMIGATDPNGKTIVRDLIDTAKSGEGFYTYSWNHPSTGKVVPKHTYTIGIPEWDWMLGAGVYVSDIEEAMATARAEAAADLRDSIITSIMFALAALAGVAVLAFLLVRRTMRPIRTTAFAMRDIAHGKGDLTRRLAIESRDEIGELATQFNAFVSRMQDTLIEVRASTRQVNSASSEIAQGSEELASRTEQAAANLQETSSSMEQISGNVAHSADAARQGDGLARSASGVAEEGYEAMQRVEATMKDISESGNRIADIISMIDSIAFQTNILALNASVEAARAGEHGKGFAVVASEVRTLASRSADASKEIRTLIEESNGHTEAGSKLVASAGKKIKEIVNSVMQMTDVMTEISAGANEQSSGISQINTAVSEMDSMTQQNASMVQQTSTAASAMQQSAAQLSDLVDTFVLGEDQPQATSTMPSRRAPQAVRSPSQGVRNAPEAKKINREAEWEAF